LRIQQWIRWVVLPRLRTIVQRGREVTVSVTNARRLWGSRMSRTSVDQR